MTGEDGIVCSLLSHSQRSNLRVLSRRRALPYQSKLASRLTRRTARVGHHSELLLNFLIIMILRSLLTPYQSTITSALAVISWTRLSPCADTTFSILGLTPAGRRSSDTGRLQWISTFLNTLHPKVPKSLIAHGFFPGPGPFSSPRIALTLRSWL
jgi:hypothetical protein